MESGLGFKLERKYIVKEQYVDHGKLYLPEDMVVQILIRLPPA